jgi:hypothetical protein
MNWSAELAYFVTPKSGPMRAIRTLHDVNHALLDDLTPQQRYQRHWFIVGRLLLEAVSSKSRLSLMLVTDALVMALEIEGWMTLQKRIRQTNIQDFPKLPASPEPDQREAPLSLAA